MGKTKKEIKVKEPVRIREKVLEDGRISLYLDMYYKGNRKKEGLKLYIIPGTSPEVKQKNQNTRNLADQIKAQRILDIEKDGLVDWEKLKRSRTTLTSWLEHYVNSEEHLSASSTRSKRNAKARVDEYLESIGSRICSLRMWKGVLPWVHRIPENVQVQQGQEDVEQHDSPADGEQDCCGSEQSCS